MKNKIPRKFNKIIGKVKIKTSLSDPGDTISIVKDEFNRYIGTSTVTGVTGDYSISMIRDASIFEIVEVIYL